VEGYVAKGILISPMYIYNKNAAALWGVWGGWLSKIVRLPRWLIVYSYN
jgi:hypothetical protein